MRLLKVLLVISLATFTTASFAASKSHQATHHQRSHQQTTIAEKVNINTADAQSLTSLKRIGAKKADAIVAYRSKHGKFKSVQDLTKVKGISSSIIEANKERLVI